MKNRIIALICIIAMCFSVITPVYAEETPVNEVVSKETNEQRLEGFSGEEAGILSHTNPLYGEELSENKVQQTLPDNSIATFLGIDYISRDEIIAAIIREAMVNRAESVKIYYTQKNEKTLSQDTLDRWIELAMSETDDSKEGDYLRWHYASSGANYTARKDADRDVWNFDITISLSYYTTLEQEKVLDRAVAETLESLRITDNLSDYEKVTKIYDFICNHVTYDYDNLEDDAYTLKFSAYAAMINQTSVCQGYTTLFYYMAKEAGLDVRVIAGLGNGGNHAWNIVKLGNKYYYLDATWDAGCVEYDYFLKGSENFEFHDSFEEYTTKEFERQYPISPTDYVPPAIENAGSGTCGENLTWTLDSAGTLVISGTGKIAEDSFYLRGDLRKVIINEGVTGIGSGAFNRCRELDAIYFMGDAPEIADDCFVGVTATVYYPNDNSTWTSDSDALQYELNWQPYVIRLALDRTSEKLPLGEKITLIADCDSIVPTVNEVTWSSSNESVATVNKSGKITAVGLGKAAITATFGVKTAVCQIEVVPAAPVSAKAVLFEDYNNVKVSWSASEGATGYAVYYKKATDTSYSEPEFTADTHFVKKDLVDGTEYDFKIIPYYEEGDIKYYDEAQSVEAFVSTLKKMSAPSVSKSADTKVKMSWTKLSGASGYEISCSTSKTATENVSVITSTGLTVIPTRNVTFYYKVRAFQMVDGEKIYGPWSNATAYDLKYVEKALDVKVVLYGHNDVKVTWKKIDGIDKYIVYCKKAGSTGYAKLGATTATSYSKADLGEGTEYIFKVVPSDAEDDRVVLNSTTNTASIFTLKKMSTPKISKSSSTKVKMSWAKISGASGYEISYSTSKTKDENISRTTSTSKTITPTRNKTIYYKVRAYKTVGEKRIYGPWSSVKSYNLRYVAAVSGVKAVLYGYDDVKVSWKKTTGANAYIVYYKKSGASSYTKLTTTTKTSYKKANLTKGVKYTFKVVPCYREDGDVVLKGTEKTASVYTLKKLNTPKISKSSSSKVKVTWNNISGESGYQISQSTSKSKTKIVTTYSTTSGKSKKISAKKGKTYYYKVRAYKTVDGKKIYGPWSSVKSYKIK